ncbi:DUF7668 domain-containing protein [Segnochrobactraceae bacterium EtOH-i3]
MNNTNKDHIPSWMNEGNLPDWARKVAFNIFISTSERKFSFLKNSNITTRLSGYQMEREIENYPSKISSPPHEAIDYLKNIRLTDGRGWSIECPFYDASGNRTDLVLDIEIYGSENNYKVYIIDILVP